MKRPNQTVSGGEVMTGPLEGIRVLEWAVHLNGAAAGYMLGDLGADVIKIEKPGEGDQFRRIMSSFGHTNVLPGDKVMNFEAVNRSKRGVVLDLKKDKGKHVLYRLVEKSDVFFTNFPKSLQAKLGVDYQTLSKHNPKLIYAYNGGYGSRGLDSESRAMDGLVQARTGFMDALADRDSPEPWWTQGAGAIFDQAGATLCVYAILAALLARERLGIGQEVETSLFGTAIHLQVINIDRAIWLNDPFPRFSRKHRGNPLNNYYQCADGKWLAITEVNSARWWRAICQALSIGELENDPQFATIKARETNHVELISILDKVFATKTRQEWLKRFAQGDFERFAHGPINTVHELTTDPQALENEYIVEIDHPSMGKVKAVGCPVRFSRTPVNIGRQAPELGEHTEEVLLQVGGYSWDEIVQLKDEGVI